MEVRPEGGQVGRVAFLPSLGFALRCIGCDNVARTMSCISYGDEVWSIELTFVHVVESCRHTACDQAKSRHRSILTGH